jgi:DegV family protein with EDD domain
MGSSCILTDSAAHIFNKSIVLQKTLGILPYLVELEAGVIDLTNMRITQLPEWNSPKQAPTLLPPDEDVLSAFFAEYQQRYDDLFVILTSASLFPAIPVIEKIASKKFGRAKIHLIDSQSTSIGEGILIQKTVGLIQSRFSADEIEEILRQVIPHIFTILCTPNFSYLHKYGFLDRGQAIAGEVLSVFPILSLDNGKLNPLEKFKNLRGLLDYYIEFIDEFDQLESISLILPDGLPASDFRTIKQYTEDQHPEARYLEVPINPFLATMIGPQGMGLVIEEKLE